MSNQPQQTPSDPEMVKNNRVMIARIFHGALLAGLVIFLILAAIIGAGGEGEAEDAAAQQAPPIDPIWIMIGVLGVTSIAAAAILPGIFAKQAGAKASEAEAQIESDMAIGEVWFKLQIIRMSLLEGAGLLAAVALLISGDLLFLIPAAVFIGALVVVAPSRAKLDAFEALATGDPHRPTAV